MQSHRRLRPQPPRAGESAPGVIDVLFIQSQSFFGADTELHAQLMRYMDRTKVRVHVALTKTNSSPQHVDVQEQFRAIDDLQVVPTNFGGRGGNLVVKIATRSLAMTRSIISLTLYIRRHDVRVVHGTEKPRDAATVVILGKLTGARSVVHAHVSYGEWMSPLVKWSLKHADAVIGVSAFTRASLVRNGTSDARAHEVLNALDLGSGRWNSGDRDKIRAEFSVAPTTVLLGVVSRLFTYKGHLDLLEALASIDSMMPDYRLMVVGEDDPSGDPADGPFSDRILETAGRLGIVDRLIMAGFRKDTPDLMAAFDLYTMPSWEEPFGMVFVEAMALCRPVVAWKQAGPTEIVINESTGRLIEPKDIRGLGEAILDLATDDEKRRRFGAAGRQRVLDEFDSPRMCRDVVAVYERAIAAPKRGRGQC